ncbi:hypothetical protein [Streptomyces sp. NPDC058247]|uniref:RapZ C-terminal domain-containing protein n=1 Tax=Streptomyces sp. NPDC058247 TaxID=3346401 RepID=UPI0036E86C78
MVSVTITTFGYDHGTPAELSDIALDIRRHFFFRGTRQIPDTEQRTGLDPYIANTVLSAAGVARLVDNTAMVAVGLLADVADTRARPLKIAVGDDQGVHWSVAIAEEIARILVQCGIETEVVHSEIQVPHTP